MFLAAKTRLEAKYRGFLTDAERLRQPHVLRLLSLVDDINLSHLLHQDTPLAAVGEE